MNTLLADSDIRVAAEAMAVTLRVSLLAMVLCLPPGVLLAAWLARTRSRARVFIEGVLTCPLVVPPVVTGLLLLHAMLLLQIPLAFTWQGAAVASAAVGFPLLVRTVRATVESIDSRLYTIAATLGASRLRILYTITLPLAWRGIVGGGLLAWGRAAGEFGATIVVAGNMPGSTQTLPLAIWTQFQGGNEPRMWVMVWLAVAISFAAVILSERMIRPAARGGRRA